jgi:hypothetical protein
MNEEKKKIHDMWTSAFYRAFDERAITNFPIAPSSEAIGAVLDSYAERVKLDERRRILDCLIWSFAAYEGDLDRICMHVFGMTYDSMYNLGFAMRHPDEIRVHRPATGRGTDAGWTQADSNA